MSFKCVTNFFCLITDRFVLDGSFFPLVLLRATRTTWTWRSSTACPTRCPIRCIPRFTLWWSSWFIFWSLWPSSLYTTTTSRARSSRARTTCRGKSASTPGDRWPADAVKHRRHSCVVELTFIGPFCIFTSRKQGGSVSGLYRLHDKTKETKWTASVTLHTTLLMFSSVACCVSPLLFSYGGLEVQDTLIFNIQQQQFPVQMSKYWNTKGNQETMKKRWNWRHSF